MSTLTRTLHESVMYPSHDPRAASAEYTALHQKLIFEYNEPCWICGLKHSSGGAMETHHSHIEWAAANGVDIAKVMIDFPSVDDTKSLREWLDSEGNMLVLCETHHRHLLCGIHCVTYPAWLLQRYQGTGWTFIANT